MGAANYTKKDLEELRKLLSSRSSKTLYFVAVDKKMDSIIGSTNYAYRKTNRTRHRVEFGWDVHPDYFGRSIGTKLLNFALADAKTKGFKRAEAEMAVKNISSWKLALTCGFKIEGIKKKALLTDGGKYIDTYIVGKIL